jgi:L-iditol 2-dehydrogenase
VINAKENVSELVKKYNEGRLADLVILCAGAFSAVKQALESVDKGGTILLFALPEPGKDYPMPLFDLWNRQIKMVSTYAGVKKISLKQLS